MRHAARSASRVYSRASSLSLSLSLVPSSSIVRPLSSIVPLVSSTSSSIPSSLFPSSSSCVSRGGAIRQSIGEWRRALSSSSSSSSPSSTTSTRGGAYEREAKAALSNPSSYWYDRARRLEWSTPPPPENVLTKDEHGIHRWFKGGELNLSHLALDAWVARGEGDRTALIWDSPVTNSKRTYSVSQLLHEVTRMAGVIRSLGVTKGDRVVIYMPMIPEALISMLACARIGAIHSVVFGGFAPAELAHRIDDCSAKLILTASCGIEGDRVIPYKPFVDEALTIAKTKVSNVIVVQRPQVAATLVNGRDWNWHEIINDTTRAIPVSPVPMAALDPLYILYTSGTTGKPKGVVRDNGAAVAFKYTMDVLIDAKPKSTFWASSDVGWVVGHTFIVYGPLIQGCATVMFEGKPVRTPDPGAFWRVVAEHKVEKWYLAPTAFRAIRKEDPTGEYRKKYDLSSLKSVFLAGERLDPPTFEWLQSILPGVDIVDNWWQTESGTPMIGNPLGIQTFKPKSGSATVPIPGYDVQILDHAGKQLGANETGNVVVKLPLPPGNFYTLWNAHERFVAGYMSTYPGYYLAGDGGYIDDDGYVFIMGRIDDVINVAGHRLSTGEMEAVVGSHSGIAECCVIGIEDALKGEIPVAFVVLKDGVTTSHSSIQKEVVHLVRKNIGPLASLKSVAVCHRLPKTRSGKILRATLRALTVKPVHEVPVPATVDDPAILSEIAGVMKSMAIGKMYGPPEGQS